MLILTFLCAKKGLKHRDFVSELSAQDYFSFNPVLKKNFLCAKKGFKQNHIVESYHFESKTSVQNIFDFNQVLQLYGSVLYRDAQNMSKRDKNRHAIGRRYIVRYAL